MQKDQLYMSEWRKLAEEPLGWGDSTRWTDTDFEKLAELIFVQTNTMLSITTLKRVLGRVKYDSSPNVATLNAMAKFVGFNDWRTFKQHTDAEQTALVPTVKAGSKKKSYWPLMLIAAAMALVFGVMISWSTRPGLPAKSPEKVTVKFESKKVADGLPNSVVFNYAVSGAGINKVLLQQSWDPSRTEELSADQEQHTSIYYYPGYFMAKLLVNGQIKKETPVFIKTQGWTGIIETNPTPTYLSFADMHLAGALGITGKTLTQKTGSFVFNDQVVGFYNVKDFTGLNGDDFKLETTVRNTSKPGESSCRRVTIYIFGKQNAIIIPLAERGCSSALNLFTSSDWVNGKDKDLSALGCDFDNFQHFSCSVKDMTLSVSLNNKQVFSAHVTQTIKEVAGLCISFEGSGEIKNVKLGNKDQTFLQESF